MYRVQNDQQVIINMARPFDEGVLIDTYTLMPLLSDRRLNIGGTGQKPWVVRLARCTERSFCVQTSLLLSVKDRVVFCLANGLHQLRTVAYALGEESYEIRDQHLLLRTYLPVSLIDYPRFNVATCQR